MLRRIVGKGGLVEFVTEELAVLMLFQIDDIQSFMVGGHPQPAATVGLNVPDLEIQRWSLKMAGPHQVGQRLVPTLLVGNIYIGVAHGGNP